jgi:hypothetical protein
VAHSPGVFVSHSWQDEAVAKKLAADLGRHGASPAHISPTKVATMTTASGWRPWSARRTSADRQRVCVSAGASGRPAYTVRTAVGARILTTATAASNGTSPHVGNAMQTVSDRSCRGR